MGKLHLPRHMGVTRVGDISVSSLEGQIALCPMDRRVDAATSKVVRSGYAIGDVIDLNGQVANAVEIVSGSLPVKITEGVDACLRFRSLYFVVAPNSKEDTILDLHQ